MGAGDDTTSKDDTSRLAGLAGPGGNVDGRDRLRLHAVDNRRADHRQQPPRRGMGRDGDSRTWLAGALLPDDHDGRQGDRGVGNQHGGGTWLGAEWAGVVADGRVPLRRQHHALRRRWQAPTRAARPLASFRSMGGAPAIDYSRIRAGAAESERPDVVWDDGAPDASGPAVQMVIG